MDPFLSDVLTFAGLALTLIGAGVTAWAVILKPEDAVHIGVPRWAGDTDEENLELPMVQNLLAASWWAKWGLVGIALGTILQMVPIAARLF